MSGLDKQVDNHEEVLEGPTGGVTVLARGFNLCGIPKNLTAKIRRHGVGDLTVISNNYGADGFSLSVLLEDRQIRKMIASYIGEDVLLEQQLFSDELEVGLTPRGLLAGKIRADGTGIPAFLAATGYGTPVTEGKEAREFNGCHYILGPTIAGDFTIVKDWEADHSGDVVYRRAAQNFNPLVATTGRATVVEVEEIVEPGELDPTQIHTPDIYANRIIQGRLEKYIEERTLRA